MVTDTEIQEKVWELQARELGRDAGRAAGSWAADGHMDKESAARVLWMIRGGDPAAVDYLPREPNLSGEMADEPTPRSITEEIAGDLAGIENSYSDEQLGELQQRLADAWEEGVSETFELACEAELLPIAEPDRAEQRKEFLHGYMECALWSSSDEQENPLDDNYSYQDISAELRVKMEHDCARFVKDNHETLERFTDLTGRDFASHGHDLWLTRNGHGAGYWDRYLEVDGRQRAITKIVGDELSERARELGAFEIMAYGGKVEAM